MTVDTEVGFFEGAEKLLEIWFEGAQNDTTLTKLDLGVIYSYHMMDWTQS